MIVDERDIFDIKVDDGGSVDGVFLTDVVAGVKTNGGGRSDVF